MQAKTRFIIINLIGLLAALAIGFNCNKPVPFEFAGQMLNGSPGLLILMSYVAGAIFGAASIVPFIGGKQVENVAKLKEWQEQDAKLKVEVQSDKEKQLEAKIATLEAALKQALGK